MAHGNEKRLELVWDVTTEMSDNWFNAQVSAISAKVVALNDWVSEASYNVFPVGVNDPSDGVRKLLENPMINEASPKG